MTETTIYLYVKSFHIISIIAWCAAMLYLPRLYVYHVDLKPKSDPSDVFKIMEKRLAKYIMNPAMFGSLIFGILLTLNLSDSSWDQVWLQAKILFVIGLLAIHMAMANWRRNFANNRNTRSKNFYRIANEIPTVLMIGIVIFVIIQPF